MKYSAFVKLNAIYVHNCLERLTDRNKFNVRCILPVAIEGTMDLQCTHSVAYISPVLGLLGYEHSQNFEHCAVWNGGGYIDFIDGRIQAALCAGERTKSDWF